MGTKNDYIAGWHLAAVSLTKYTSGGSGVSWATIGSTEDGWTIHRTIHEQDIHDDRFGMGIADTVNQGADYRVTGILLNLADVKASGVLNVQQAEGATNNNVGKLGSSYYMSLCLTPLVGTPAAALIGAGNSYVFDLAAITNDVDRLLASKMSRLAVTFKVLPDQNAGNLGYEIIATPAGVPASYP